MSQKSAGMMTQEKKFAAGENKHGISGDALRKLDDSTEAGHLNTVDRSLSIAIAQARQAKKMTQKQLAQAINEPAQTIQTYENGKAVPNGQTIAKLDKALGIKLPRPRKN
jgi:putative transcription factor